MIRRSKCKKLQEQNVLATDCLMLQQSNIESPLTTSIMSTPPSSQSVVMNTSNNQPLDLAAYVTIMTDNIRVAPPITQGQSVPLRTRPPDANMYQNIMS